MNDKLTRQEKKMVRIMKQFRPTPSPRFHKNMGNAPWMTESKEKRSRSYFRPLLAVLAVVALFLVIGISASMIHPWWTEFREKTVNDTPAAVGTVETTGIQSNELQITVDNVLFEFTYVPEGQFTMGSKENDSLADSDEKPRHTIHLDGFGIMKTEVTNAQYQLFIDAGGYQAQEYWSTQGWKYITNNKYSRPAFYDGQDFNQLQHPVVGISWFEAQAFANWLASAIKGPNVSISRPPDMANLPGMTFRLPTEAEWEKAACGTDSRIYPWGDEAPNQKISNFDYNVGMTTEVGTYFDGASPYGALDMAGNVWEWTADWYNSDYYAQSLASNPSGPEQSELRVLRGGAYDNKPADVRCASRHSREPHSRFFRNTGFRLAVLGSS